MADFETKCDSLFPRKCKYESYVAYTNFISGLFNLQFLHASAICFNFSDWVRNV